MLGPEAGSYAVTGQVKERTGSASGNSAPRNVYKTRDGRWIAMSGSTDRMAKRILLLVGGDDLARDPRYATNADRVRNRVALDAVIGEWIGARDRDTALQIFRSEGITVGPVHDIADFMADDHVIEREVVVSIPDPDLGPLPVHNVLPRLSATPGAIRRLAPEPGADAEDVLRRAGFSAEEIDNLRGCRGAGMIPAGYDDRVYAGWLGKCIGVRFGAPLENWTEAQIRSHIGELEFYLSEDDGRFFKPDDDTAFSMILARIFEDCGASAEVTTQQIAEGWLNYLGDQHGTLWWGGYGVAAMHTAYVNLAAGIPAPLAGSAALNGRIVAEEIGGQIFADIWGLMAPGRPDLAADLSERAARVAWDGNALQGARFVAAMVSAAFAVREPAALIAAGLARIDRDGDYAAMVRAMVDAHRRCPDDWRTAFAVLSAEFGYDRYPGTVPIVPNAGVIVLALLYGAGDFSRALRIAAMAGWDTDCNVGNVGAVMGVAVGVDGIDPSWRRPVNDILVNAGLIGGRNLMTIPQGADLLARLGRGLAGVEAGPKPPRRHVRHDGAMGGFQARATGGLGRPIEWRRSTDIDPAGALAV